MIRAEGYNEVNLVNKPTTKIDIFHHDFPFLSP